MSPAAPSAAFVVSLEGPALPTVHAGAAICATSGMAAAIASMESTAWPSEAPTGCAAAQLRVRPASVPVTLPSSTVLPKLAQDT
jgi:hypothetical protein